MGILVIALSINPRPLSALELTLSGLIMGSRVDTAGDNQNPHVIISNYHMRSTDARTVRFFMTVYFNDDTIKTRISYMLFDGL